MIYRIGHVCAIYFDMIALSGWQLKIVMSSFIPLLNEGKVLVEKKGYAISHLILNRSSFKHWLTA